MYEAESRAKTQLRDDLEGTGGLYGFLQTENTKGEKIWIGASTAKEFAALIKKLTDKIKKYDEQDQGHRTIDILWTQDEGLSPEGEEFMNGNIGKE
jgi:predicted AlkP superfamily phosphohydrolase/phosphomutase